MSQPTIHLEVNDINHEVLSNSEITSWNGFTTFAVGGATLPRLMADENYRYVRFGASDASATKGNYLSLGTPRTWNIANGFTAIGMIRFYATRAWQRWFDFGNGAGINNILWAKSDAASGSFHVYNNGTNGIIQNISNVIPNNAWIIVIARVTNSTTSDTWYDPNNTLSTTKNTATGTLNTNPRSLSNNWIGRSLWSDNSYACLDIRESLFYDRALTDNEIKNMVAFLRMKYVLNPTLPAQGMIGLSTIRDFIQPGISLVNLGNFYRTSGSNNLSSYGGIPTASNQIGIGNFYRAGWIANPNNIPGYFAHYTPQSWSTTNNRWNDISGNERHTIETRGSISLTTSLGINALVGSSTAGLRFPASVLPSTYTLFHVARYTVGLRGRIFNGLNGNWLSGFWSELSGVAHHESWLTQSSTSLHGTNWVISCDQNKMYRSNGVQRNTQIPTGSSQQLTINHGNSLTEYSDWAVAEVIVYNRRLSPLEISRIERFLSNKYSLPLEYLFDALNERTHCMAAYSMKRLSPAYYGPVLRLFRPSDSTQEDFYADSVGNLTTISNTSLSTWSVSNASINVITWYDQSGRNKHLNTDSATRPVIITSDSNAIHISSGLQMSASNVFNSSTIADMHFISTLREMTRGSNRIISFNGSNTNDVGRFFIHGPWENGRWHWDSGDAGTQRAFSTVVTNVGDKVVFSGYKSSSEGKNGFRLNGTGTTFLSSGTAAASVSGGLSLIGVSGTANYIYNLIVFDKKLSAQDETFLEKLI
jgi:hypothetical protein